MAMCDNTAFTGKYPFQVMVDHHTHSVCIYLLFRVSPKILIDQISSAFKQLIYIMNTFILFFPVLWGLSLIPIYPYGLTQTITLLLTITNICLTLCCGCCGFCIKVTLQGL